MNEMLIQPIGINLNEGVVKLSLWCKILRKPFYNACIDLLRRNAYVSTITNLC